MKTNQKLLAACAAAVLFGTVSSPAVDRAWDGGAANGLWLDPVNWNGDTLPVTGLGTLGDALYINDTVNFPTFTAADGSLAYRVVRVGYGTPPTGANANGRLDITGGTLTADSTDQVRIGRGGRTGTINQSGGTFNAGGIVQLAIDAGSTGNINLSGGTFNANRNATADGVASVSIHLGAGTATTTGNFNLTGGTLASRTGILLGQGAVGVGNFHVGGAGLANIGHLNATDSGFWVQRASGTLKATVDSTGFTLGSINIFDNGTLNSYLQFDAGSKLDLGFSGAAPGVTTSWDLMTFRDAITTTGSLTLDPLDAAAGWSYGFVDAGGGAGVDLLRVTYTVPEPAVGAMAGLGLLLAVMRARKHA